ncbi:unnamed protein product [Camellia sinensis]
MSVSKDQINLLQLGDSSQSDCDFEVLSLPISELHRRHHHLLRFRHQFSLSREQGLMLGHKSWRVREEFARTVTLAIGLFASTELPLQRAILPPEMYT